MSYIILDITKRVIISPPLEEVITFYKSFKFEEISFYLPDVKNLSYTNKVVNFMNKLDRYNIDILVNRSELVEYNDNLIIIDTIDDIVEHYVKKNKKMIIVFGSLCNQSHMVYKIGIYDLVKNSVPICIIEDYVNYHKQDIDSKICCTTQLDGIIFKTQENNIYFVDIDETICSKTSNLRYEEAKPWKENIEKLNRLYNEGHTIIYWTSRGALSGIDFYELTKNQLDKWGVKYHKVKIKKPYYDRFIDDKSINLTYKLEL